MTIILGDTLIMPMSKSIKVSVKSELPLAGEENEIVLISEVQTENFFISNSEPTASESDVWIVSGEEGEHSIQFGKDSKSKIILLGAQQKTADGWSKLDGYVRLNGEWVQFSSRGMPISSLPVGSLINIEETQSPFKYLIVHQGLPSDIYDSSCDGTWLWRSEVESLITWGSTDVFETSNIPSKCNEMYLKYSESIKKIIKDVKIPYRYGGGGGTDQQKGNGFECRVFLLSIKETGIMDEDLWQLGSAPNDGSKLDYFDYGVSSEANAKRAKKYNGSFAKQYTRSTRKTLTGGYVWTIEESGAGYSYSVSTSLGFSPCFVAENTLLVSPTPNPDGSYNLIL